MDTTESKLGSTKQELKKLYRVEVTTQMEVMIEVDACDPEQAAAMAEAWTHCSSGRCWFDGYYDHSLESHVDERFDLDWEILDVQECVAGNVELVEDEDDIEFKEGEV